MVAGRGRRANQRASAKKHLQQAARMQRHVLFELGFRQRQTVDVYQLKLEDVKQARDMLDLARRELAQADEALTQLAIRIDRGYL